MRYKIDRQVHQPAYLQLYHQLRNDIVSGYYSYEMRMPSKRTLAEETGSSVITVEHAYALLSEEGYITPRERSGYYVCYRRQETFGGEAGIRSGVLDIGAAANESGERLTAKFAFNRSDSRNTGENTFQAGQIETASRERDRSEEFPFSVFARTARSVLTNRAEEILAPSQNSGTPELRGALSAYLARSRGIEVHPDQILIGAGAEYLYSLVVQMIGRDRVYALEDPSYRKIRQVYEANGVTCEMLQMDREGIKSAELTHTKAGVLHVTPFNSYPSGITATASRRNEYIHWAVSRQAMIVEDDYDSEFSELTKAEDTLFSLEPSRTVLYINTFSRTIAPSMRMGYMLLPAERCEELREKISFYTCTVPVFEQYVLAEFINEGHFERHINRVRRRRRSREETGKSS